MTGNDNQKNSGKRNPWGQSGSDDLTPNRPDRGPWGAPRPTGPGHDDGMPDFQEFLNQARNMFSGGGRLVAMLLLLGLAIWLGSGIYRVQPGENAAIKRFGDLVRVQKQAGIGYHLPWPVETVNKINVTMDRRVQIGFSDTGSSSSRRDLSDESLMLTADANIVDIDVVILWNISESEKYMFNIRDPESTIKHVAESAIREEVGQTRLQSIITEGRNDVATRIRKTMQGILDSYESGVAVNQVLILEATVHPDVIEAYNDVAAARQDAERFQNEAMIYRNDILPKARGEAIKMEQDAEAYAQDVVARSKGDAQRFTEILAGYRSGKDVTRDRFYIETMEQILGRANRMIIDQDGSNHGVVPYMSLDNLKRQPATDNSLSQ